MTMNRLHSAIPHEPVRSLSQMLEFNNVTELRRIARLLSIKNYGKKNKQALIANLVPLLSMPEVLSYLLKPLDRQSWNCFLAVFEAKSSDTANLAPIDYVILQKIGLLQIFDWQDRLRLVLSNEIMAAFAKLKEAGFIEKKNLLDDLNEFACAAVNLYGIIKFADFIDLFNRQTNWRIDIAEGRSILEPRADEEIDFCLWEDYLTAIEFALDDFVDIGDLYQEQIKTPRYEPPLAEFVRYSDPDYYEETSQIKALREHLRLICDDEKMISIMMISLNQMCMAEEDTEDLAALLSGHINAFKDVKDFSIAVQLITDVQNNTRIWRFNGHTLREMGLERQSHALPFSPDQPVVSAKVGRNDPCPCGSGKKFKRCCGN